MIVDVHTHIFPDDIAERVVKQLSAAGSVPAYLNGTLAALIASMDKAGIDVSVIAPVATKPSQVRSINDFSASVAGDRIVPFGTLHPDFEPVETEVKRMKEVGVRGIKLHSEYQEFHPDDERLYPMYEVLEWAGFVVLFHAGYDVEIPTLHSSPDRFARLHQAFPKLRVILAHLGSWRMWDEVEEHLVGKDVYFDTSYIFDDIGLEQFRRIVANHPPGRVLFGTDSPWTDQSVEVGRLRGSGLDRDTVDRILGENARRLLWVTS
ncbi:MAG: amidohydrolase [Actinobacteria bacterium]|nr:MAG: amidohydrolase [Actinomycetota bacterium]